MPCAVQKKVCAGTRQYVLHSKRNLNAAEAQAFCQAKHGPWASLAELDTALEWSTVLSLVKQVSDYLVTVCLGSAADGSL